MRIGIDARFYGPQETGIGRYVERLIFHLQHIDHDNDYTLFLRPSVISWWKPLNPRWQSVAADERWYSVGEQHRMPSIFRSAHLDLLHIPHFNVPLLYRDPFVVTIHDLILNQFPTERASTLGPILFRLKFLAYQAVIRHAVTKAKKVITVSNHSRQDLIARFQIPAERVAVTYEAVDQLPKGTEWPALAEHGVHQPYLLYVGNSYPHKNLEKLIDAVKIANRRGQEFQLVLVGKRDYFSRRLEAYARDHDVSNIVFFGFASDQDLAGLYTHAQAYFFPSLSEGFGLPALEAMQQSVPVFAARSSCLPEVLGSAAHYFDPRSEQDIVRSIDVALHDTLEQQRLVVAGIKQLQLFSWRTMAQETLAVYRTAVHANPKS